MRPMRRTSLAILATALLATAGGTVAQAQGPVTLRLGFTNRADSPNAGEVTAFVDRVAAESNGAITIEPVWEAGGSEMPTTPYHAVAGQLVDGSLDLAVVGSPFWDQAGVVSLGALQSPLLVDSDALMDAIVTNGPLTSALLDGFGPAGLTGLALWPESLRHPVSFTGSPLLGSADYAGKVIRTPTASISDAIVRALGAQPSDANSQALRDAVTAGQIQGADGAYIWDWIYDHVGTTTGNVTIYPRINALAVNDASWSRLTPDQQALLRKAAAETAAALAASNATDVAGAAQYCTDGGTIVLASAADIADLKEALTPVEATLEADPAVRALIDRIAAVKATLPAPPPVTPCAPAPTPSTGPAASASAGSPSPAIALIPDGVYRTTVKVVPGQPWLANWAGLADWTIAGDRFTLDYPNGEWPTCQGAFTIIDDFLRMTWDSSGDCNGTTDIKWQLSGDQLVVQDLRDPPNPCPSSGCGLYLGAPWTKIK